MSGNITPELLETLTGMRKQHAALEQKNMNFKDMLHQLEDEKKAVRDNITSNIEILQLPVFEKLKKMQMKQI